MEREYPIRILQVVGGMNRGGAETWLMHVLRNIDRNRFHLDFLVHTSKPCVFDEEIKALGSRVLPCMEPMRPLTYAKNLSKAVARFGPYDVLHSHVHHFSGFVLHLARKLGIPIRIAHSHLDTLATDQRSGCSRRHYLKAMKHLLRKNATAGLACSRKAAAALFGEHWTQDSRWQILYCGIDLEPFSKEEDRRKIRTKLGISEHCFVIGHVGRFAEQKNHRFLLEIATEIFRRRPDSALLLIGEGSLKREIEDKVTRTGLSGKVIFAGLRDDVPKILQAMDIMIMPSINEGLPLAGLEAQAAGLPLILSDTVSEEAAVVTPLLRRLSLGQPACIWADSALMFLNSQNLIPRNVAFKKMKNSPFNIENSAAKLVEIYDITK